GTGRIEIRAPADPHEWPFAWRMADGVVEVVGPGAPASTQRVWFLSDDRLLMRFGPALRGLLLVREGAARAEPRYWFSSQEKKLPEEESSFLLDRFCRIAGFHAR